MLGLQETFSCFSFSSMMPLVVSTDGERRIQSTSANISKPNNATAANTNAMKVSIEVSVLLSEVDAAEYFSMAAIRTSKSIEDDL